jgi:ankyrin repeat protein
MIGFDSPSVLVAAGCQNLELLDLLLENGADINAKSAWWAGSFAVMHGASEKMVKAFEERGAKWDIFSAAEQDRMDLVREFLEADSSLVNAKGPDGQHPLHFARSIEMLDYLLAQGAELDARDLDHAGTAAQWLVAEHPKLARYLLEKGAEADIFMLARLGDLERLKTLLDAKPDLLDKRIGHGDYPMVPLAPGQHIYVYTLGDNKSAHQLAKQYQQQHVYEFLLEHSSVERRFVAACERADGETMKALLQVSPDLPKRLSRQDQVLLVDAAWNRQLEVVKLMLEAGFDPAIQSGNASTALHSAAFHGFSEIVKLLLNYNPPLELRNDYGARPLDSALYGSVHSWRPDGDFAATIDALLQAGSKPAPEVQPTGNAAVDALLSPYLSQKKS